MQETSDCSNKNKEITVTLVKFGLLTIQKEYLFETKEQSIRNLFKLFNNNHFARILQYQYINQILKQNKKLQIKNKQYFYELVENYLNLIKHSISFDLDALQISNLKLSKQAIQRLENNQCKKLKKDKRKLSRQNNRLTRQNSRLTKQKSQQKDLIIYKNILKVYTFTNLSKLRMIAIQSMQLDNIQIICSINCPDLYTLLLDNNNIKSLKILDKTNFKELNVISTSRNKSIQLPSSRIKLNTIDKLRRGNSLFILNEDHDAIPYQLNTRIKYQAEHIALNKKTFDSKTIYSFENEFNKCQILLDKKCNNVQNKKEI